MGDDVASSVTARKLTENCIESVARELGMEPEEVRYVIVFRGAKGYLVAAPEGVEICSVQPMDVCHFIEHIKEEILQSHNDDGWSYLTFAGYSTDYAQAEVEALRASGSRRGRPRVCILDEEGNKVECRT